MQDELETRLRAARDGLGGPDPTVSARIMARLAPPRSPGRARRLVGALASRPARAIGATVALGGLLAVLAVLFVNSSSVRTASGPPREVPNLTGMGLDQAYRVLRQAGFTISIPWWFRSSAICPPTVAHQSPGPGSQAPAGSAVTLTPGGCALASLFGHSPQSRVAGFAGRSIAEATRWAAGRQLLWDAGVLGPLRGASAPELLDNYRVERQYPAPGTALRNGVLRRTGNSTGFQPTPLELLAEFDPQAPRPDLSNLRFQVLGRTNSLRIRGAGAITAVRDLRGTVSVLTLVKAPCQACAAQVVRNATLAAQTPGLVAAVVGADGASPNLSNLAAERGATLGRLVSPRDALEPVAGGPGGLPTTILVDRSGRAARVLAGPVDIETIRVTVRTLLAEPLPALAGPLTPLRLARLSQPSVPRTQIPSALLNRGLMSDVCPVDPDHVYLLATAATGDARLYIARTHGNGLVIHVAGRDGTGSSLAGCGPGAAKAIATQLNRDGLLGAGLSATKPKGGPDVIRSFAFVLADGYTEAVVGGTRYPINGNGFVLSGRFADRTTVVFRGPAGLIRRTLAVGPSRAG